MHPILIIVFGPLLAAIVAGLGNRMLGNGVADAVDETAVTTDGVTVLANRWVRNRCTVDIPTGEIC